MIFKFLLEISNDVQSCFRLMLNLQQKFDFRRVLLDENSKEDKSPFVNSINVIESSLKYRKHIADGVVKYFDHLSRDYELNLLDATLLIILLNSPRKRISSNFIKLFLRRGNLYDDIFEDFCKNVA
uniref:Uncharacterized protein n=1 Tax=Romanomermis culicivorax TaxID=13658 RepID=A0A915IB73_ROMCU